ncbi:MAG: polysaccharide biosynthesis protein [Ruminococcaceae bacterium]|nr:polysaccharide biosynthesis protein [Oscillospiraceae bacterium]
MNFKSTVIKGTFILTVFSVITRVIGFVFRVWLSKMLGSEGMGLYQLVLSLYILAVTLSTAGISMTVSKLCSEFYASKDFGSAKKVFKKALFWSLLCGFTVSLIIILFAKPLGEHFLGDTRTILSLYLLAPGMPFMSASACINGYFFAKRKFLRPAASQFVEQAVKIGAIALLMSYALPKGLAASCAAAVLGMTVGEISSCIYEIIIYLFEARSEKKKAPLQKIGLKLILKQSAPIAANSYINSGLRMLENVLLPSRLIMYGMTPHSALSIFGILKGMVMPLIAFPSALLTALASALIPTVSGAKAAGQEKRIDFTVSKVLQLTLMLGIIIVAIFISFPKELGICIYDDTNVGSMLAKMALISPFIYLEMVVVSVLNGLSQQVYTLKINMLDGAIRLACIIIAVPFLGFNGYLASTLISCIFCTCLYIKKLLELTNISIKITSWILKPALCACAACLISKIIMIKASLPNISELLLCLGTTAVIYTISLLFSGCIPFSILKRKKV